MLENRWLLPEGIEELLPPQATRLETLHRRLVDLYDSWGYELVMPPFIEYIESLLTGTGNDLDLQTFKLIDQLTGRLMGVRADMTPQVARIDAHRLKRDVPSRLCYLGTVLHTRPQAHGGTRSPVQVGAELYGHPGPESDIEVLQLMVETLRSVGLERIHLDLGHVGVFRALACRAGLSTELEGALFDALQRKAMPEIEALLATHDISAANAVMLKSLADLNGGGDVFGRARAVLAPAMAEVGPALDNLQRIAETVEGLADVEVHFDLAELRGYHYHTGAVFAAFVPGRGQAVAQGGRYDDIGRVFGRARPATGFSIDLTALLALVPEQPHVRTGIYAPWSDDTALACRVAALRKQGERVIQALPGQGGDAAAMGCDRQLLIEGGEWQVVPLGAK